MSTIIIDMQGFQMGPQFIPKELSAINADTGLGMSHHIFREPYPIEELDLKQRENVQWLTDCYHGLSWSGIGHSHLCDMQDILDEVTYNVDKILCKGVMKKAFLEKYVGTRCEIVDLETEVPSIRRLNLKAACTSHNYESSHCALTNVFFIYHYLRFNQVGQ